MSDGKLHTFYCSEKWRTFRAMIIIERTKENGIFCERCGKRINESDKIHIHHSPIELTEKNYMDVSISLNPSNVQMICQACHNVVHPRGSGNKRKDHAVYIICGPPMSGKTTYVQAHMLPGDIVMDMDRLYEAISFLDRYNKPECLKYNVFHIRNCILDQIKNRYGKYNTAWIIGGYARKVERERLAYETGADIIVMNTKKEECIQRLENCGDYRGQHKDQYKGYIEKWFEEFVP